MTKKAYQREILDYNFHFSAKKLSKVKFFRVLVPAYTKSMSEKAPTPQLLDQDIPTPQLLDQNSVGYPDLAIVV